MVRRLKRRGLALIIVALLLYGESVAYACAVCVGNPDDPQTIGMNKAILGLLAIVGAVLTAFAAFFITLWRRAKNHAGSVTQYVDQLENKFRKEEVLS